MECRKYDLLTLGEVLLRLSPPANERMIRTSVFEQNIGGAELNVAAGAAQLGLRTGMIGKIPSNDIGRLARNEIHRQNVSDEYLLSDDETDARLGIYFYEGGAAPRKPRIVYDRRNTSVYKMKADEFPEEMFTSARCFHTCGITLALDEKVRKTAVTLMRKFKEHGTLISFDVNFRGNLWSGEEARKCIEEILPLVDIFFCSDSTARLTFQKKGTPEEVMKSFTRDYPLSIVAATDRTVHSPKNHSFGSVIYDAKSDRFYKEKNYENIEVVDRIGSGDAYIAGALYGILKYPEDLSQAVSIGNAVSALKNTVPGDFPAMDLSEVLELIHEHQSDGPIMEMKR